MPVDPPASAVTRSDDSSGAVDEREIERWLHVDGSRTERLVRLLTEWYWDGVFRLRSYGAENVPAEGGFILCANHSSYADPFLQARGQTRLIRFMTKAQAMEWPLVGRIIRTGGGFPVRRGQGDALAMELARRMLADGQPVCIYPEGTRFRSDAELGPPKRGAARLALEMGVPVLPVATWGTKPRRARGESWFPPRLPKVTTIYGRPMRFAGMSATPENVDRVRDEIWAEVQRLYTLAREVTQRRRRPRSLEI